MPDKTKILLDVANQIEKDNNYCGITFFATNSTNSNSGCAMTRILMKDNAFNLQDETESGWPNFKDGSEFTTDGVFKRLETITGINELYWDRKFFGFSANANRFQMAAALRYIASSVFNTEHSLYEMFHTVET